MSQTDALKEEIRQLEARIATARKEMEKLAVEFADSNDELGQLHLSARVIPTES